MNIETVTPITWEEKVQMIRLGNRMNSAHPESTGEFQEFKEFLEHVLERFDGQAFDMLINIIDMTANYLKENRPFFKRVVDLFEIQKDEHFGFRAKLRYEFLKLTLEDFDKKDGLQKVEDHTPASQDAGNGEG
jgi:hypothetical protein